MSKKKTIQETMSSALLTTAQLEQSGIKTSLNQNDIVEIIAVEAYDNIMQTIQSAPKFDVDLFNMNECKEAFAKEVNKLKGHNFIFTSDNVSSTRSEYNGVNKLYTIKNIFVQESNNESIKVYLESKTCNYNSEMSCKLCIVKYADTIKSGDLSTVLVEQYSGRFEFAKTVNLKASISQKQFETMLDNHNQAVSDLYNSIPVAEKKSTGDFYKLVNFKSISTQARVSVNKNIIKNQAPEVTEQLNKLFGVNM
jgi:hypothetical protein